MNTEELYRLRAAPEPFAAQAERENELGSAMALELAKIAAAAIEKGLDWETCQTDAGFEYRARLLQGVFAIAFSEVGAPDEAKFGFGLEIEGESIRDFAHGPAESIFGDAFQAAHAHCNRHDFEDMPRRVNRLRCIWAKLAENRPEITGPVNERLAALAASEGDSPG